ncbi:hypothetical protein FRC03_003885 [Tulasnella sp. 419]|nr:hypothetical protein FRC03_003885 [Tulasnella sp. 419]
MALLQDLTLDIINVDPDEMPVATYGFPLVLPNLEETTILFKGTCLELLTWITYLDAPKLWRLGFSPRHHVPEAGKQELNPWNGIWSEKKNGNRDSSKI